MSALRCLQLGTPVKVCWESLTQFPPPSPCVLCNAATIEGNLPQTSHTVKNEANDNFADCLLRREMEKNCFSLDFHVPSLIHGSAPCCKWEQWVCL